MKTWATLKEGMAKISNEVRQIMLVRNDMVDLQSDLKAQEEMWRQAEEQLDTENAGLRVQVEKLREELLKGASLEGEVKELRHRIAEAKLQGSRSRQAFANEEGQAAMEEAFLRRREQDLLEQLSTLNATASAEAQKARNHQMQLETASQALRLKAAELEDQLKDDQKELPLQKQQAALQARELRRQLAAMQAGLKRMEGQIKPRNELEQQMAQLQAQLKEETLTIIKVKQDQIELAARCQHERERRQEALYAEESKAQSRHQEMLQLCGAVQQQHAVLQQMAESCEGQFGLQ